MVTTELVWRTQFDQIGAQLEKLGAIVTEPDGFQWIDCAACGDPHRVSTLAQLHQAMTSVGYARGWI